MASGPIISWEIDGERWEIDGETGETVSDFIFWGSKLTADGDCSHEIKRRLLLGRKGMTNLDSILTHSSVLAWRIPGMAEPDGLPSVGLHRVGHD